MLLTINLRYEIRQDLPVNLILSEPTIEANAFDFDLELDWHDKRSQINNWHDRN